MRHPYYKSTLKNFEIIKTTQLTEEQIEQTVKDFLNDMKTIDIFKEEPNRYLVKIAWLYGFGPEEIQAHIEQQYLNDLLQLMELAEVEIEHHRELRITESIKVTTHNFKQNKFSKEEYYDEDTEPYEESYRIVIMCDPDDPDCYLEKYNLYESMGHLRFKLFLKQQAFAYRLLEALFKQYRQTKATTTDYQVQIDALIDAFYHELLAKGIELNAFNIQSVNYLRTVIFNALL